jgi:hypothetical protein
MPGSSGPDAGGVYHRRQKFGDRCQRRLPPEPEDSGTNTRGVSHRRQKFRDLCQRRLPPTPVHSGTDTRGVYHRRHKFADLCQRRLPSMGEIRGSMLDASTIDTRIEGYQFWKVTLDAGPVRVNQRGDQADAREAETCAWRPPAGVTGGSVACGAGTMGSTERVRFGRPRRFPEAEYTSPETGVQSTACCRLAWYAPPPAAGGGVRSVGPGFGQGFEAVVRFKPAPAGDREPSFLSPAHAGSMTRHANPPG